MSRFHVGQRVRVIGPSTSHNVGMIGTVLRVGVEGNDYGRRFIGIEIDIPHKGRWPYLIMQPHNIEPLDDDTDKASWEQVEAITKWRPQGVTV